MLSKTIKPIKSTIFCGNPRMTYRSHFEIAFFPKEPVQVIKRFETRLENTESLKQEVGQILAANKITIDKIFIRKVSEGKGSKKLSDMFEGFLYKQYDGKIRGIRKGFLSDRNWKNDFELYLLYGKEKDGIMFKTDSYSSPEIKKIGQSIYERLLISIMKNGPIPWNHIQRIGTVDLSKLTPIYKLNR